MIEKILPQMGERQEKMARKMLEKVRTGKRDVFC
jgi:hypothetical protein